MDRDIGDEAKEEISVLTHRFRDDPFIYSQNFENRWNHRMFRPSLFLLVFCVSSKVSSVSFFEHNFH